MSIDNELDKQVEGQLRKFSENPVSVSIKWGLGALAVITLLGLAGSGLGWFTEAAAVAKTEFGPQAALRKYEWFKDAAASLDKKAADLTSYEVRMESFKQEYNGVKKSQWPRDERQAFNQLNAEYQGMKQMYNSVAAEYNAQSTKFNWSAFDATNGDNIKQQYNTK